MKTNLLKEWDIIKERILFRTIESETKIQELMLPKIYYLPAALKDGIFADLFREGGSLLNKIS